MIEEHGSDGLKIINATTGTSSQKAKYSILVICWCAVLLVTVQCYRILKTTTLKEESLRKREDFPYNPSKQIHLSHYYAGIPNHHYLCAAFSSGCKRRSKISVYIYYHMWAIGCNNSYASRKLERNET